MNACLVVGFVGLLWTSPLIPAAYAHHSFAMYDQNQTKTLTGNADFDVSFPIDI